MTYNTGMENTAVDRENTWLSIQEAADHLGVNPRTVRRYMRLGRLEASRVSNKVVRIRLADLDRFMDSNVPAKKEPEVEPVVTQTHAVKPASLQTGRLPGRF